MKTLLLTILLLVTTSAIAGDGSKAPSRPKKVLVELFTSQGCDSCPSANQFLGELARLGYGPDQVVPISFHVDYFNQLWVDPYSNKDFSRRELAYNSVLKRNDLYFTPMMMVDGRSPMLGSNRPEAIKAIKKAMAEKPGVAIKLVLASKQADLSLSIEMTALSSDIDGRSVMIGTALVEGPITTRVTSGENAGSALVEPFVVRSFQFQQVKLEGKSPQTFHFPIKPPADSVAANCRVSAFVQDWDNGKVYQADSIPLVGPKLARD